MFISPFGASKIGKLCCFRSWQICPAQRVAHILCFGIEYFQGIILFKLQLRLFRYPALTLSVKPSDLKKSFTQLIKSQLGHGAQETKHKIKNTNCAVRRSTSIVSPSYVKLSSLSKVTMPILSCSD